MMFWYGPGMDMWGYVVMTASMVMFWGLVILAVVAAARHVTRSAPPSGDTGAARPTAEQILAERFARGDRRTRVLPPAGHAPGPNALHERIMTRTSGGGHLMSTTARGVGPPAIAGPGPRHV